MKIRILIAVLAAAFVLPLAGCNSANDQKQSSQSPHKTGAEAAYGGLTSTKIKRN